MTADSAQNSDSQDRVLPPLQRRRLQQCFEHGTKLMGQAPYDFDYAHSLLVECVVGDPGNLVYLDAFFLNLQRKYNNNKRGAVLNFGGKGAFKKAIVREDWADVLRLGPDILKSNPWDVAILRGLADACGNLGYHETELRYLRNALEVKPRDAAVNRHCALALSRVAQFDQAISCWQRVDEAKGGDQEAQEMISQLQVEKTENARSDGTGRRTRGIPKRATEAIENSADEPNVRREIRLTPRQELEQSLVHNPTDVESYFALSDLHIAEGRLGDAAHLLTKALSALGNDLKVQARLEDVEMLRKRRQVEVAEKRAGSSDSPDAKQLAEQLRVDLNRYELEIFDARSQRFPQDLELRFQLGLRLKQAGNFRQAIDLFREAATAKNRKSGSAFELGECHQRLKQYGQALEHYQRAAELARESQQAEIQKLAIYRAALLAAGLGNGQLAEQQYSELLTLDPGYKDAASRLDKLREMRHKE